MFRGLNSEKNSANGCGLSRGADRGDGVLAGAERQRLADFRHHEREFVVAGVAPFESDGFAGLAGDKQFLAAGGLHLECAVFPFHGHRGVEGLDRFAYFHGDALREEWWSSLRMRGKWRGWFGDSLTSQEDVDGEAGDEADEDAGDHRNEEIVKRVASITHRHAACSLLLARSLAAPGPPLCLRAPTICRHRCGRGYS